MKTRPRCGHIALDSTRQIGVCALDFPERGAFGNGSSIMPAVRGRDTRD